MLSISRVTFLCLVLVFVFSQNLVAQCNNNSLVNPGFENGLESWDVSGTVFISGDAASGSQAIEISGDGNRIYQTLSVEEGQTITFKATAKKTGPNGDANIGIKFLDGSYGLIDFSYATLEDVSSYASINTISATAPALAAFIEVTAFTNAASSSILVDDFCLTIEGTGTGPKPDLVINNLRGDFFINAGDPFDLTFDLGNIGQQIANGDLNVGVYISSDDQLDASDQEMIVETYSNTPVGGTNDLTAVFITPSTLASGNHYLIVVADILNQISESNEDNNSTFRILEVGGLSSCDIELTVIDGSILCDDNNTMDNPSDDTWSFQLLIENILDPDAEGWKSEIAGQNYEGEYGNIVNISGLSISQGALSFLVQDKENVNCEQQLINLSPPSTCSNVTPPPACEIEFELDQGSVACNDNGTPTDPTDDTWSFSFKVENANPQLDGWRIELNGQSIEGNYGETKSIDGLEIFSGSINLNIVDVTDNSCTENISGIQPPSTCSNVTPPPACEIEFELDQGSVACNDNGTPTDPTDDTWSFSFIVENANPQLDGWRIELNGQSIEGNYGETKSIDGLEISSGSIDLNIVDVTDNSCTENISGIQPPSTCSAITPPSNDRPDLTILDLDVNQILNMGAGVNTEVEVSNLGLGAAIGSFEMEYFVSNDEFLSADDILVNTHTFGNFMPGSVVNIGISFSLPVTIAVGEYHLITFIDSRDNIDETDESNNIFVNEIRIEDAVTPPFGVCEPYALFPWQDYIGKVKINEEGFSSGKSEYSDFRNFIFDVPLLESNAIELTAFFSWENFDEYFSVYIDFNQDGAYQADEVYYQGKIDAKPNGTAKNKLFSGPFSINPPNAVEGLTTMRVMMSRDGYPSPCDVIDFGEVEDYSVNVVEQLDYNPYLTKSGNDDNLLFVYPNPATEYINIRLENAYQQVGDLMLVDPIGRVLLREDLSTLTEDTYELEVANFQPGLYSVYLTQENKRAKHSKVLIIGID